MHRFTLTGLIACLLVFVGSYAYCQASDACNNAQCKMAPRVIQIKAQIEVKYPAKYKGKCEDISRNPIISTVENNKAVIDVSAFVPSASDEKKLVSIATTISVLPVMKADGHINVDGSLTQDGEFFSVKDAKFSASLEPGKPLKLPVIAVPANKGKDKATAEVTLTAVVIPN